MNSFDLIIIGAGPGGYPLALRQAQKGWKVAVVEADQVGGTCLNWGCIPTKALLASAKGLHFLHQAGKLGLTVENVGFAWDRVQARKDEVVRQLRGGIEKLFEKAGVTLVRGVGTLQSPHRVAIAPTPGAKDASSPSSCPANEIEGQRICLAVGSVPGVPASFPQDRSLFWTSDEALHCKEIPASLLVVGGGVIGLELGQVFAQFGSKVTVVEMMPQILPGLDTATAKRLLPVFKKAGLEILVGQKVEGLQIEGGRVVCQIGGAVRTFDRALLAIGRRPNLRCLEGSPLSLDRDGPFLKVNERFETSQPGVYAIGDAIRGPMLAHKATYDAETLARQWNGEPVTPDYSAVPSCVYTYPEIAWVGMSEEEAQKRGLAYTVGRFLFSANGRALAMAEGDGQVKVLVDADGRLLGAVLWGPEASDLIMEPTIWRALNLDKHGMERLIHPHPTLSEAFLEAYENALGRNLHG
ncbi:MAG: Dihydrolipoamide dehydrogenase of 2-oxoglutarate dehydrogenase [Candidatus Ozemobacter sibiricus]|jgi:dihydrolipoamide dehydrogenase|uniref:Dihydrolipoyl dehydrogenase n=1 Tax=Candidatus Ozemobacter sibiricus TaxID=2268124 RepID=A0A367ZKU2_9BACT|nr:MAG: Dihydrolipoamide dehydrogenase of 2-oxoglutarate dehydrogenase [Candidatus Ozemobacter sibiricus]